MQKVSVITMTYNDLTHLKQCVDGILKQDYENIEYIIVDGASTDGTVEFLTGLSEQLGDKLRWVSEPDKGLYDALNKGIDMAAGDIIGIMNDCFAAEDVITRMVSVIEAEGTDGVHGNINYVDGQRVVRRWRMGQGSIRTGWMVGHPTMYLKREVYEMYGRYDLSLKIAADYEFMIRILKDGTVKLSYIDDVLVNMFHGENSTSTGGLKNYIASFREGHRALVQNGVRFAWVTDLCRIFRFVLQFFTW